MSNPTLISIDKILGIKDYSRYTINSNEADNVRLFKKLGFAYIQDIIEKCKFKPIIIDLTVSNKPKWAAASFGSSHEESLANLNAYISALKHMLEKENRLLYQHPKFKDKREIIICNSIDYSISPKGVNTENLTEPTKLKQIDGNIYLHNYVDNTITIPDSTDDNNSHDPEKNAQFLYSLFCQLRDADNYIFVSIPITYVEDPLKMDRKLKGGAFLVLGNDKEDYIKAVKLMCLRVITIFHKGLIDWHEVKDTIENCGVEQWLTLRKLFRSICFKENIYPRHLPYGDSCSPGGSHTNSEKQLFIKLTKNVGVKYINDIKSFKEFDWDEENTRENNEWTSKTPPIRAIAQYDSNARDFSIFMEHLQKDLSLSFSGLEIYFKQVSPNNMVDCLWFNPVPLGNAIYKICEGLKEYKEGHNFIFNRNNKARVDIVYGFENSNNEICFFINIYEYGGSKVVFYKHDCWKYSTHSLKSARNCLYICGVRHMVYSGFDSTDKKFKSQLISLSGDNLSDIEAKLQNLDYTYKTLPPFITFLICGNVISERGSSSIEVNGCDNKETLCSFFKEKFCNESNNN